MKLNSDLMSRLGLKNILNDKRNNKVYIIMILSSIVFWGAIRYVVEHKNPEESFTKEEAFTECWKKKEARDELYAYMQQQRNVIASWCRYKEGEKTWHSKKASRVIGYDQVFYPANFETKKDATLENPQFASILVKD
jgi:hypothetical protein